jgi:hypothetical protein
MDRAPSEGAKAGARGEPRFRLETIKTIVEIVAIILAGGWALIEFGLKEREARLEGQQLRRATLSLKCDVTQSGEGDIWVLSHLIIKNASKRQVRTFLISWWWYRPPWANEVGLQFSRVTNDPLVYDLGPGEESEVNHFARIPGGVKVAVMHAEVIFEGGEDDKTCRLSPKAIIPDGGVMAMRDQPMVCAAPRGSNHCTDDCPSQAAEALITVESPKEKAKSNGE